MGHVFSGRIPHVYAGGRWVPTFMDRVVIPSHAFICGSLSATQQRLLNRRGSSADLAERTACVI